MGETKKKIRKLILVAPWKIPSDEFDVNENELYDFNIDPILKERVGQIIIFTSNNEDKDGKESVKIYHNVLGGKIIELKKHGHFIEKHMGTKEFPELLEEILKTFK